MEFSVSKLFSKGLSFWGQKKSIVGIDIGSSSIKVVQLRREKEQAVLETYGELASGPYGGESIGQVVKLPEEKIVEMLKDLFKESGVNAERAGIAIPVKSSFLTTLKIPVVKGANLDEMVKYESRKYIPVPLGEVNLDWWVLPSVFKSTAGEEQKEDKGKSEAEKKLVEVLLVAIYKDVFEKYRRVVSAAGIKDVFFEIEVFSIPRSVVFRQTMPIMIIDLGAFSTKMSIIDEGVLRTSHIVGKGSQDLTIAISKALNITFQRAEEMKRELGLSEKPEHQEFKSVMEPILNYIFAESKQFMLDYRRKAGNSVGRVVLAGGGALLAGIVDMVVKNLGIEVSLADSFSKIQYPPFLDEVLKGIGPSFSVSVGLALRGLK